MHLTSKMRSISFFRRFETLQTEPKIPLRLVQKTRPISMSVNCQHRRWREKHFGRNNRRNNNQNEDTVVRVMSYNILADNLVWILSHEGGSVMLRRRDIVGSSIPELHRSSSLGLIVGS